MASSNEQKGLVPHLGNETSVAFVGTALTVLHEAHKRGWEYIALGLADGYLKFLQKNGDLQDLPQSQYDALKGLTAAEYLRQYVTSAQERKPQQEEVSANLLQRAARRVVSGVKEAKDTLYMYPMLNGIAEKIDKENVDVQTLTPQQLQNVQARAQEYGKVLASKDLPLLTIGINLAAEDAQEYAKKLADEFAQRLMSNPQDLAMTFLNFAKSYRRSREK